MAHFNIKLPTLAEYQRAYVYAAERITAVEGCTGSGKTFVHEPYFFQQAHQPTALGDECWWLGPTTEQVRSVFDSIMRKIERSGAASLYTITKAPMRITTPAGGVMVFKTAENPDHLFGPRNVRLIIVDEFTRCRVSIWPALLTVSNKTECRIMFIGNYTGDTSAWHLWIKNMEGAPDFAYFRTTAPEAVEAGIMKAEVMDKARRTLSHGQFQALYMCEGTDDPSLLVEYGAVSDLWTNDHVAPGTMAMTCDLAFQGSDRFALGVWAGMVLQHIYTLDKCTPDQAEQFIREKATMHAVPHSRIVYDADGMGHYLRGYLKGAVPYSGGSAAVKVDGQKMAYINLRAQCHYLTADAVNARTMYISTPQYRPELEQELFATLRTSGQNASLAWGIVAKDHPTDGAKARLGRSPDLSDMMVMRQYLELGDRTTFLKSIAHIAERDRRRNFRPQPTRNPNNFPGR